MLSLSSYVAEITSILDFSALVRGRRQALGLSQAELATRAHVSRQWISAFESGRPGSELRLILRLLEALDLRLSVDPLDDVRGDRLKPSDAVDLDALLEAHREAKVEDERDR
jgi:transcriptional regulator with XRE-family HTH domain